MSEIYLDAPNIGETEKKYLNKVLDSGYVSTVGPFVPEFEERFAEYVNARKAVAIQNGTIALYMSLYELGIGPGDEVIVPGLTFIASVNPVLYAGATPVIVDVEPDTWCISPQAIEEAITPKTKAVIPVHLFGNPCDMDSIMSIARAHNLYIVEDATESIGSHYNGQATGTFGDFGCFSFNGNKVFTSGGGGMIVSEYTERLEHIKFLINQTKKGGQFFHPEMGFNFRLTNLSAGLGLAQFSRLDEFLQKKRAMNNIYKKILGPRDYIKFQKEYSNAESGYWFTGISIENGIDIDKLMSKLADNGIPTRRNFVPMGEMPYLKTFCRDLTNAYRIYGKSLCLPSSTLNSLEDIEGVAGHILEIIERLS